MIDTKQFHRLGQLTGRRFLVDGEGAIVHSEATAEELAEHEWTEWVEVLSCDHDSTPGPVIYVDSTDNMVLSHDEFWSGE